MTYSVLDKFGERLCEGTRGYCEEMVLRMKWREVIITRYVKKYIPKKKIITTNVFKNFKTSKNNYKQQIVAIFEDGHREVFETVEQVASRFNVVVWNGAHAGFELKCKENNYESMLFANASYGNYEIIGNKIDNPDLWYGGSEHDTED